MLASTADAASQETGPFTVATGAERPVELELDSGVILYVTLKEPREETFEEHSQLLSDVIESYESREQKPPPGVLAEYAFYLARLGETEEANRYFKAEMEAYPESAIFVTSLERMMQGQGAFSAEPNAEVSP